MRQGKNWILIRKRSLQISFLQYTYAKSQKTKGMCMLPRNLQVQALCLQVHQR
jgi:hypothetical protein